MRIALVHYTSAPVIGGVERVMAAHARLFAEAGHEVTVLADWTDLPQPHPERTSALLARLRPMLAGQRLVFLHNVATMHFDLALTSALWDLASELTGVRFICWVHDLAACNPDYALPTLAALPWSLLRQAHPRFTYIAVSELRRRQLSEISGLPESNCEIIPNGVEPAQALDLSPRIKQAEADHHLLDRDILLLHPARLLRRKNVELTLHVTAAIKAQGRSCACLITAPPDVHHAASAEYADELRRLQALLGLENDAFFFDRSPPLDEPELRSLFSLADALFFPSRQEGFGIPILEAALHRLPIFCAEIEPLKSLLPEGLTTFSLTDSPAEIDEVILRRLDSDLRYRVRRHVLQAHSWRAIYRNFLARLLA